MMGIVALHQHQYPIPFGHVNDIRYGKDAVSRLRDNLYLRGQPNDFSFARQLPNFVCLPFARGTAKLNLLSVLQPKRN
jgi:hypothetical protein